MAPKLTVVMPARDEEDHITAAIESLAPQISECGGELIVAEGGSMDCTRVVLEALAERYTWLRILTNPGGHPAVGLNRAVSAARSSVIVRADAHTEYAEDYLPRLLTVLADQGLAVVGGGMNPRGRSPFGKAVAAAMRSTFAVGPGRFHHTVPAQSADTVYLGAYPKSIIEAVGGYRAFPSRAGEDADLYARVRRAGFTVWLDPSIRTWYRPRESPAALFKQSWRYGVAKAEILLATGALPSWRPIAPMTLTAGIAAAAVIPDRRLARAGVFSWLALLWWGSRRRRTIDRRVRFVCAAAIMQLAYGAGAWFGLLRGPRRAMPLTGRSAGWEA